MLAFNVLFHLLRLAKPSQLAYSINLEYIHSIALAGVLHLLRRAKQGGPWVQIPPEMTQKPSELTANVPRHWVTWVKLDKIGPALFKRHITMKRNKKVFLTFVVDNAWAIDLSQLYLSDPAGFTRNVLYPLGLKTVESSINSQISSHVRTRVRSYHQNSEVESQRLKTDRLPVMSPMNRHTYAAEYAASFSRNPITQ